MAKSRRIWEAETKEEKIHTRTLRVWLRACALSNEIYASSLVLAEGCSLSLNIIPRQVHNGANRYGIINSHPYCLTGNMTRHQTFFKDAAVCFNAWKIRRGYRRRLIKFAGSFVSTCWRVIEILWRKK